MTDGDFRLILSGYKGWQDRKVAKASAEVTHNHPEGIKGAQAVAAVIYLARSGFGKPLIKDHVQRIFGYDLEQKLEDIRPH